MPADNMALDAYVEKSFVDWSSAGDKADIQPA